jgi:hypothetical protein
MARRLIVICDLCEQEPASEHAFGLDESGWKMDLCDECAGTLRAAMDRWIRLATRTKGPKRRPGTNPAVERARTDPEDRAAIRRWAADEGIEVRQNGQIPREVWQRWQAAGSPRPTAVA